MFSTDKVAFDIPGHAGTFEKYRTLTPAQLQQWLNVILNSIDSQESVSKIILDAGAGTGRFSIPIATSVSNLSYKVYALERSEEMLANLIQKVDFLKIKNLKALKYDLANYKPEEALSGIYISEVLHLLDNYQTIASSFYSWLDKGGWLIIRTPSHEQLKKIEWLSFFPNALEYDISRTRDIKELVFSLKEAGFSKISIQTIDESILIPTSVYIDMLIQKAYSILYKFDPQDLEVGYRMLSEYCKDKISCPHTMELTCIKAFK